MSVTSTRVTATQLARQLSDILNRIEYRGERFVIERNGRTIATIEPAKEPIHGPTVREFLELIQSLPRPDEDFADDLEEILSIQSKTDPPEWD